MSGLVIKESFPNLTMDSAAERYAITVVNHADSGSLLFTASDESAPGTTADKRPVDISAATVTGGDDGLTSPDLDDNDFIGSAGGATGNYAFDLVDDITILVSPDNTSQAVHNAMLQYCEITRKGLVYAVLDPPVNTARDAMVTYIDTLTLNEFGALYWPRVKIVNPSKTIFGNVTDITIVPSGLITGRMAFNDREEAPGPFYQPAGTEAGRPYGIVGLERNEVKLETTRDVVYPKRINPITYMRGYGYFIDGSRSLIGTGNFPSVGERRGVSHIEKLLERGLQWVRHRNHTPRLRREVFKAIYAELHKWMKAGAFASGDPATAFFVDVGVGLNTPSVIRAGKLISRVGLATNTPAEYVILKVTKDTRALNEELFGS
jgi:phage tail sheath protein FI